MLFVEFYLLVCAIPFLIWFKAIYYARLTENYDITIYNISLVIFSIIFIVGSLAGGFIGYACASINVHFKKK